MTWLVILGLSSIKARPDQKNPKEAKYLMFKHAENAENHLWLQFLITGILSVYYDSSRTKIIRPGFTSFPRGRNHDRELGVITAIIPAIISE